MHALDAEPCRHAAAELALLVVTGARKREMLQATCANVDLDRLQLTVPRAKNGRARHISLSPVAVHILRQQLLRRHADSPHVFPSDRRPGKPLENLRGAWERAKPAAGLPTELGIHGLRHSFASALAKAGTPLYEIGAVLGHTQLTTTTRYAHPSAWCRPQPRPNGRGTCCPRRTIPTVISPADLAVPPHSPSGERPNL